jgi:hypothetical protein
MSLASPFSAQSEELGQAVTQATQQGGSPTEILVSVLFALSALALLTVTGGVIYLSVRQWQDSADDKKLLKTEPLEEPVFAPNPKPDPDEQQYVSSSKEEKKPSQLENTQHLPLTNA